MRGVPRVPKQKAGQCWVCVHYVRWKAQVELSSDDRLKWRADDSAEWESSRRSRHCTYSGYRVQQRPVSHLVFPQRHSSRRRDELGIRFSTIFPPGRRGAYRKTEGLFKTARALRGVSARRSRETYAIGPCRARSRSLRWDYHRRFGVCGDTFVLMSDLPDGIVATLDALGDSVVPVSSPAGPPFRSSGCMNRFGELGCMSRPLVALFSYGDIAPCWLSTARPGAFVAQASRSRSPDRRRGHAWWILAAPGNSGPGFAHWSGDTCRSLSAARRLGLDRTRAGNWSLAVTSSPNTYREAAGNCERASYCNLLLP